MECKRWSRATVKSVSKPRHRHEVMSSSPHSSKYAHHTVPHRIPGPRPFQLSAHYQCCFCPGRQRGLGRVVSLAIRLLPSWGGGANLQHKKVSSASLWSSFRMKRFSTAWSSSSSGWRDEPHMESRTDGLASWAGAGSASVPAPAAAAAAVPTVMARCGRVSWLGGQCGLQCDGSSVRERTLYLCNELARLCRPRMCAQMAQRVGDPLLYDQRRRRLS